MHQLAVRARLFTAARINAVQCRLTLITCGFWRTTMSMKPARTLSLHRNVLPRHTGRPAEASGGGRTGAPAGPPTAHAGAMVALPRQPSHLLLARSRSMPPRVPRSGPRMLLPLPLPLLPLPLPPLPLLPLRLLPLLLLLLLLLLPVGPGQVWVFGAYPDLNLSSLPVPAPTRLQSFAVSPARAMHHTSWPRQPCTRPGTPCTVARA
jgi:hypothetical protein